MGNATIVASRYCLMKRLLNILSHHLPLLSIAHETKKKKPKADYKEYKKDEKEAEKYAKAINKGMRELEDEERKEQHESLKC